MSPNKQRVLSCILIIEHLAEKNPKSVDETYKLVDAYYNRETWSLDKEEWNKMTECEKRRFCVFAYEFISTL